MKKRQAQASVTSSEYDIFATFPFAANNTCGSNVKERFPRAAYHSGSQE